jgi:hypothetical protein
MLKFLNNMKDKLMARPRGSSNKAKVEKPVEFDYEAEVNNTYTIATNSNILQVSNPDINRINPVINRTEFEYDESVSAPVSVQNPQSYSTSNLFLISGRVRMERAGSAPIEADQQRIVYANNFVEAVAKYTAYFTSLSSPGERYTVIGAGGSEAIR